MSTLLKKELLDQCLQSMLICFGLLFCISSRSTVFQFVD